MEPTLDFNQLRAFHAFKRGLCIALIGGAGSGKSFLLAKLLEEAKMRHGPESVMACAWTNQCAAAIGGRTIHSWFGVRCGFEFDKEKLWRMVQANKSMCDALRKVEVLFVDEVSVQKENVLDAIDWVMRHVAKTDRLSSIPMGSRQLVVAGDPYQLEPIGVNHEMDGQKHVFSARSWFLIFGGFGSGVVVLLFRNHRQSSDSDFYAVLNRIRIGACTDEDLLHINKTGMASTSIPRTHTVLCLRKIEVDEVNKGELARISGPEFCSHARDTFNAERTWGLRKLLSDAAPNTVTVKSGCDVMLTRKVGNALPGYRAKVISVHPYDSVAECAGMLYLRVAIQGVEGEVVIRPMLFEIFDSDAVVIACRRQLPVVSAYALTIHRSQGMTLQNVAIDFRKISTWIPSGIAYVALSRCTSMKGLWVRGLKQKHIIINENAKRVIQDIEKLKRHFLHRVIGKSRQSLIAPDRDRGNECSMKRVFGKERVHECEENSSRTSKLARCSKDQEK